MTQSNETKNGKDSLLVTIKKHKWIAPSAVLFVVLALGGGGYYLYLNSTRIYIENSMISAPLISLASPSSGTLGEVMVSVGDQVAANAAVAKIGDALVKTKAAGEIVATNNDIGKIFNPGETVVSMIDSRELRVVGRIQENKGLKDIKVGQRAVFTVDAFPSQEYYGTVDEISPTSREGSITFNISDKRPTQEFEIKARFNINQYPELKNGMSAKMWVYKN